MNGLTFVSRFGNLRPDGRTSSWLSNMLRKKLGFGNEVRKGLMELGIELGKT
jgi:hypothetical protein